MNKINAIVLPALVSSLLATVPALAQTIDSSAGKLTASVVVEGLSHPWSLALLPDGGMLVSERSGQLRVIRDGVVGAPVQGTPEVYHQGQGGLLDIALAPDFAESGQLYLSFSEPGEGGAGTAVLSAKLVLDADSGRLEDQRVIFRMNKFTGTNRHFGSRIVVGQDGNLFVTLGERGEQDRAQDLADLAGAVVRITPDGAVPDDNPKLEGWAPELWSKGHRNPQGAALRSDGQLFVVEHGPMGGDELNKPQPGANYGWPLITYGVDYSGAKVGEGQEKAGLEQPLHYWVPSISPSGLAFHAGDMLPGWEGDLLTGGLSGQMLVRLDMDGDSLVGEERLFEGQLGRIRDVRVADDGAIYVLTDEDNGRLIRVAKEGN
ncbi:MAG: PQQ-dependent sugar dehydrogenase [Alphaproteobacteria bacterium]|nr:PQQ-dependent sugar dehydrogenase [Alphaproteobacteria bacterium]